jgi:predicted dehydrogenase
MVAMARASGKVAAVCYNTRFYPLNQHAHGMMKAGELGDLRLITGHFHQDWLAKDTDWNWRLEAEEGGPLRSVSDIGTHWVDLTTSSPAEGCRGDGRAWRPSSPNARSPPARSRPSPPPRGATETGKIETDDAATILLRYGNGGRGMMSTSQVSHGRRGLLAGTSPGLQGLGRVGPRHPGGPVDRPPRGAEPDPAARSVADEPDRGRRRRCPAGTRRGSRTPGPPSSRRSMPTCARGGGAGSTWATFEDGHYEMLFCDAVLASAQAEPGSTCG